MDYEDAIKQLQDQQIEQINPYIVERYLYRLDGAGLIRISRSPVADEGLFNLSPTGAIELPPRLRPADGDGGTTLVATVGSAKLAAVLAGADGASRAVDLSPSMDAFRRLVDTTGEALRPALFRGGVVADETTTRDYDLFLYESEIREGGRRMKWRQLVRIDGETVDAVRFDVLNNLVPLGGTTAGGGYHPGWQTRATDAAKLALGQQKQMRADLLDTWQRAAAHDLDRLPRLLSAGASSGAERSAIRDRVRRAIETRKRALTASSELSVGSPTLIGWCRVRGAASEVAADEQQRQKDSEAVSMRRIKTLLRDQGWHVDDVAHQNVGWDLEARKGVLLRTVEVKGIWGNASSEGIRLTGNEMIRAGINGDRYWLYVVDRCSDGTGRLATVIQNPADKLDGLTRDIAVLSVKGSDLMSVESDLDQNPQAES